MVATRQDVTALLRAWSRGDADAGERLLPIVYGELRRQAPRLLRRERRDHTLEPTALVHETYLRLIEQRAADWKNRTQFFAVAATAMRRILVDHARRHGARKRGGSWDRISFDESRRAWPGQPDVNILALEEALEDLAERTPRRCGWSSCASSPGSIWRRRRPCSGSPNRRSPVSGVWPAPGSSGDWAGRPGRDDRSLDARERVVRGGPRSRPVHARRLPGPAVRRRRGAAAGSGIAAGRSRAGRRLPDQRAVSVAGARPGAPRAVRDPGSAGRGGDGRGVPRA